MKAQAVSYEGDVSCPCGQKFEVQLDDYEEYGHEEITCPSCGRKLVISFCTQPKFFIENVIQDE